MDWWQRLMDWLPDLVIGQFEIRDLLSLVVAGVGVVLAYYAIRMGRKQIEITKRQADIAEVQHQIMQEQLARKSELNLVVAAGIPTAGNQTWYRIQVENLGTRTANNAYYNILIPTKFVPRLDIKLVGGKWEREPGAIKGAEDQGLFSMIAGHIGQPVYASLGVDLGSIMVPSDIGEMIMLRWGLFYEDGHAAGIATLPPV